MIVASEETGELYAALAAAQGKFPAINKGKTAKIEKKAGGHFTYNYSDLADVVKAAAPILSENGIAVIQVVGWDGQMDILTTRVGHKSGQWFEGTMRLFASTTPQGQGSSVTYARRYAYCAAVGIVSEEDDDGQGAESEVKGQRTTRRSAPQSNPAQATAVSPTGDLATWDIQQITAYLTEHNLPLSGTKEAKRLRIAEHQAGVKPTEIVRNTITNPQLTKIAILLKEKGLDDTDEMRHTYLGAVVDRTVNSTKELTLDEAGKVIEALEGES